jgi:hypothetical protein
MMLFGSYRPQASVIQIRRGALALRDEPGSARLAFRLVLV